MKEQDRQLIYFMQSVVLMWLWDSISRIKTTPHNKEQVILDILGAIIYLSETIGLYLMNILFIIYPNNFRMFVLDISMS